MSLDPNISEPLLEAAEIQGNILGGFNKDHQAVLPLYFDSDSASVAGVRSWLAMLIGEITWLPEVVGYRRTRKMRLVATGVEPSDLPALWMNISFSYPGLRKLSADADHFEPVFRFGLPAGSGRIGDPTVAGNPGHISSWIFGRFDNIPDMLAIIAGDDGEAVKTKVDEFIKRAALASVRCPQFDIGHDLAHYPDGGSYESGREHFGFKDGISQPGVRGRISANPDLYVTERMLPADPEGLVSDPEFSAPGQPLVFPGEFVLGYSRQSDTFGRHPALPWVLGTDSAGSGQQAVGPSWAKNGSFLVYRRLRQDVPAFNRFLKARRDDLAQFPEFKTLTVDQLGAMLVGRWHSGAPLLRSPSDDNPYLGKAEGANNAFGFQSVSPASDGFPNALPDPLGEICPAAAHVRKVNPRDLPTDQNGPNATLVRRILRRGIPFGPPIQLGATEDPEGSDRGLLFLSYQASIRDQFEFLSTTWVNDKSKPTPQYTPNSGFDMIIGQNPEGDRLRFCLVGPFGRRIDTDHGPDKPWVVATGGGYFFTPSRSAIRDVLARSPATA
jgi:Dyp-type peroxidase family